MTGGNIKNNAELAAELASNNIELKTDGTGTGNITVAAPVSWTTDTALILTANNNIYVNANITASGNTAGLVLAYGTGGSYSLGSGAKITLSGASPTLTIGGNSYIVLNASNYSTYYSSSSLDLTKRYALGCDVNASGTTYTTAIGHNGIFSGIFDGLGHTISNLTIVSPTSYVGLFAQSNKGTIKNVGLVDANVTCTYSGSGYASVGGLVGMSNGSTITNCYITGTVTGNSQSRSVGGLVGFGYNNDSITNCHSAGTVQSAGSDGQLGGLVGSFTGSMKDSYSSCTVSNTSSGYRSKIGGLVGVLSWNGSITNCYSNGSVIDASTNGNCYIGGLVGDSDWMPGFSGNITTISGCYSSATVTAKNTSGTDYVAGLVGINRGKLTGSYSSGTVSSNLTTGGQNTVGGW